MSIYEAVVEPDKLKIISMDEVEPEEVLFLSDPYIPANKITLLQGDPGGGKTMFCMLLAACVSSGRSFPWEDETGRNPAPVLIQTAEDGIADTIHPRLTIMKANMANVHYIDESHEPLSLVDERLIQALEQIHPVLLIIDPLQAYLGSYVDMHRANQVRPVLSHLGHLAQHYNCSILLVMHLNKGNGKALYRGLGSIDFNGAARSVLVIGCNPKNPEQKVLAHAKHNLSGRGDSIAFRIDSKAGIVFDGFSDLDADQVLKPVREKGCMEVDKAVAFLNTYLKDKRYARLSEIKEAAAKSGIADRTLSRAKEELKLKVLIIGFAPKTAWWMLPNMDEMELRQTLKDTGS